MMAIVSIHLGNRELVVSKRELRGWDREGQRGELCPAEDQKRAARGFCLGGFGKDRRASKITHVSWGGKG